MLGHRCESPLDLGPRFLYQLACEGELPPVDRADGVRTRSDRATRCRERSLPGDGLRIEAIAEVVREPFEIQRLGADVLG
jgi:hypothetical protein